MKAEDALGEKDSRRLVFERVQGQGDDVWTWTPLTFDGMVPRNR